MYFANFPVILYDSVGNGNIGILIGDYKIKKSDKEIESMRDSVINVPKVKENPDDARILLKKYLAWSLKELKVYGSISDNITQKNIKV